jgi:PAS domain S-box-containing protein
VRRKKILVVDDNSTTRRMVRAALQRKGHDVLEAADGATARELMARERPCVVLQDLMLPDTDGFELVGELRGLAEGTEVSILAFSGFISDLDEARISMVGFDDFIAKPIAPSRLVPLIEAHMPHPVASTGQFGTGHRVAVVDDDPLQLKLATFRLTRLGFAVDSFSDGRSALEAAHANPPDAIVSDVMMPELDGFGLAMLVRRDDDLRRVPVVLVTSSYVEPGDRDLARRAGATDLVPRTPELAEVIDALRSALSATYVEHDATTEVIPADLEREHNHRVLRQLERQVMLNAGLAKRCSALASELTVLTGISEAVLKHRDVDIALDEALGECFDAGGLAVGALFLIERDGTTRMRPIGASTVNEELVSLFGHAELLRDVIANGRTLSVPSPDLPRDLERSLLQAARAQALLMVPLVYLDRTLGSLLMVARTRELEEEDWRTLAHGLATQISHVITLARAFEDRELAERRATEQAQILNALFDHAPDTVAHLDLEGNVRFANRSLGGNIFDAPASDHREALRAAFDRMTDSGEPQGFEASSIRSDGSQVWLSTRLGPIKEQGAVIGAVLVSRDVTADKQTEMHLMAADRMASVGTLAAGVAHEINNPLASVIANLDMAVQDVHALAKKVAVPRDLTEELEDASTAAGRVREIVRDLKIFSRTEVDRRGPVDVENVLDSTLRMAWNELRHRARVVKAYGDVPPVDANESRLGQVFLNLIINAAHAIPPGNYESNQIRIATEIDPNGCVLVTIADTGAGIPADVRPRLFTPFFTTKPVGVGTGLGLAISHRIITQFGGTIGYETEVGRGTMFHVTLPLASGVKQPSMSGNIPIASTRRGAILIIDDEEPLAVAVKRYLSNEHDVTTVNSAHAALDLLRGGARYDVILCDLMMPQVTGMELHAEVAASDPAQAAKIVFVTGGAFTTGARDFLDRVPNRRLEKPFDLGTLRALVNQIVR